MLVLSESDQLQSVNTSSANKVAILCSALRLLNCITETVQATEGRMLVSLHYRNCSYV